MTKRVFLEKLLDNLSALPKAERQKAYAFYAEIIDGSMEDGVGEEEAVQKLGSVDEIAEQIIAENPMYENTEARSSTSRMNIRRWLAAAALLIVAGVAIFGSSFAVFRRNEGGYTMETQTYALSGIEKILINTDSPGVVIRPVTGDQINMTWQADDYVELEAELTDGMLSIDYRFGANWLESLLLSPLNRNDYVLEIELPDGYAGKLDVHTASGSLAVYSALAVDDISLTTVSGTIDASDIDSQKGVVLRSTSGRVHADAVHAAEDIRVQSVSGALDLRKATALGGIAMQTNSGGVTGVDLNAGGNIEVNTTSGAVDVKRIHSDADIAIGSVSGTLTLSGVDCEGFSSKSVSGGIKFQELTADTMKMKSTSGTVSGTVGGVHGDYSVSAHTVSGRNNLQNTAAGRGKSLSVDTVSGGISVRFSDDAGE